MSNSSGYVVCLVLCLAAAAGAQQPTSPPKAADDAARSAHARKPPIPKANGPTLEFTMEYIQEKLINRGVLNYDVFLHDSVVGKDWSYQFSDKLSGTYANPGSCQIGFHWKQARSGQLVTDSELYFDLRSVAKVDVLTMEQYLTEAALKAGHSSWTTRVSPAVFVLRLTKPDNQESNFVFPDEDLANHLAKALLHAIELCASTQNAGGQAENKEPF
jgi:hypothetical protein